MTSTAARFAAISGIGIFLLPTSASALEGIKTEESGTQTPTTLAQAGINPQTGRPITEFDGRPPAGRFPSDRLPIDRLPGGRLPGGRLPAGLTSGRSPAVVLPDAARIDSFARLNPRLGLSTRYRFNTLSSFKNRAPSINQLRLGNAKLNLSTYTNSRNSFSSVEGRISPYTVSGSVSGKARVLSASNDRVAILETLTYQPKYSTCNRLRIQRATAIGLKKTSPEQRATRELCFSRTTNGAIKNRASSASKSKIKSLKAELTKASNNKVAKLPAWARGLNANQLNNLSKYSDKQLAQVLANNAKITRVRTIIGEKPSLSKAKALQISSKSSCKSGSCDFSKLNQSQNGSGKSVNANKPTVRDGTYKVDEKIYLTGFTFAESFYWTEVWSATIDYGVDTIDVVLAPYAEAYYGLGARFPLKVKTDLTVKNNGSKAELAFDVKPIDANPEQYTATGLPPSYIFNGKELVAEAGAEAGLKYTLPIVGAGNLGPWGTSVDFTTKFPDPLTNGQFVPPSSRPVRLGKPIVFDSVDLLFGQGNYQIEDVGGASFKAHPGISIGLSSPDRGIKVVDMKDSNKPTTISSSRKKATIKLDNNKNAKFKIKDPYYNLALTIYPGIKLKGEIDILGWEKPVSKYIDFPSLGIDIPSGGIPFGCHAGTICSRTYDFKAGQIRDDEGPRQALYNHTIRLKKNYRIKDEDTYTSDDFYNKEVIEQPRTVQRPQAAGRIADASIKNYAQSNIPTNARCAGGEVRGEDWDRIEVDSNGVARMWVSIELWEEESCDNNDLDGFTRGVGRNGVKSGRPFLEVQPGGEATKTLKVTNTREDAGDYVRIIYTLKNESRRIN